MLHTMFPKTKIIECAKSLTVNDQMKANKVIKTISALLNKTTNKVEKGIFNINQTVI